MQRQQSFTRIVTTVGKPAQKPPALQTRFLLVKLAIADCHSLPELLFDPQKMLTIGRRIGQIYRMIASTKSINCVPFHHSFRRCKYYGLPMISSPTVCRLQNLLDLPFFNHLQIRSHHSSFTFALLFLFCCSLCSSFPQVFVFLNVQRAHHTHSLPHLARRFQGLCDTTNLVVQLCSTQADLSIRLFEPLKGQNFNFPNSFLEVGKRFNLKTSNQRLLSYNESVKKGRDLKFRGFQIWFSILAAKASNRQKRTSFHLKGQLILKADLKI